mmetsp:Transcript_33760/g.71967  ORF Transcript_33760/g.71967 Transcript_33760/m.71967 type:complete len:231 (+) Transcript_33760:2020-2712(+)
MLATPSTLPPPIETSRATMPAPTPAARKPRRRTIPVTTRTTASSTNGCPLLKTKMTSFARRGKNSGGSTAGGESMAGPDPGSASLGWDWPSVPHPYRGLASSPRHRGWTLTGTASWRRRPSSASSISRRSRGARLPRRTPFWGARGARGHSLPRTAKRNNTLPSHPSRPSRGYRTLETLATSVPPSRPSSASPISCTISTRRTSSNPLAPRRRSYLLPKHCWRWPWPLGF